MSRRATRAARRGCGKLINFGFATNAWLTDDQECSGAPQTNRGTAQELLGIVASAAGGDLNVAIRSRPRRPNVLSGKTRKGSKWLRMTLVESAQAAARTKDTYLAAQYARIKGRHGHRKAIIAVAHSILVIAYHLLERQQPYNELGGDYFIERQQKDAYQRRLVKQLERMGYDVNLTERAA
jgi:hypothetical protein